MDGISGFTNVLSQVKVHSAEATEPTTQGGGANLLHNDVRCAQRSGRGSNAHAASAGGSEVVTRPPRSRGDIGQCGEEKQTRSKQVLREAPYNRGHSGS